jgi:predicted O-methyltransferase YrrM
MSHMTKDEIIAFAETIEGWMSLDELATLIDCVRGPTNAVRYVEVGSFRGRSAAAVYLALPSDSELSVIDKYKDYRPEYRQPIDPKLVLLGHMERCRQQRPDIQFRLLEMDSLEGAKQFEDDSLDFVFIDADHEYQAVLQDIHHWLPKVKPGGCLSGHDYNPSATSMNSWSIPTCQGTSRNVKAGESPCRSRAAGTWSRTRFPRRPPRSTTR